MTKSYPKIFFGTLAARPLHISRIQSGNFFCSYRISFSTGIQIFVDSDNFKLLLGCQLLAIGDLCLNRF